MSQELTKPDYWEGAKQHLSTQCPVMKRIIARYKGETLSARGDGFYTLARSIVGQQISVKAADSVWGRFAQLSVDSGQLSVNPAFVTSATDDALRSCGLSAQKVKYLRAVAEYFVDPPDFTALEDADLLASLTSIKGVGVWTAEMFMIFHLLKPDVFPVDDIGLLKAIGVHYGDGENKVDKPTALEVAEPWQPYRTVATWYLWRSLDPVVVEY